LRTNKGLIVKNRDHWTIQQINHDGTVTLSGPTGAVTLPADYARDHLELGYAQTSHASQGRTVENALLLQDVPTDSRGVYTPMTRGRYTNHAYVVIEENQTGADVLSHSVSREWADRPAIARRAQLTGDAPVSRGRSLTRAERVPATLDHFASPHPREPSGLGLER
ncbi:MAG TPA: hypothetical protein VF377_09840, partial [Acidimicrobiia bacterium]